MNQLLTQRGKRPYYGEHVIDMYVFSVWLSDYNRERNTKIRPSTATAATFDAHLAALKRGWWKNYGKEAA